MTEEKTSKRQERRDKAQQREKANRLRTMGLIVAGVGILVFLFISQQLKPVTGIVTVESEPRPMVDRNSMGDANAPIQIVEYSDFQCPFCERFATDTEPLLIQSLRPPVRLNPVDRCQAPQRPPLGPRPIVDP